MLNNVVEYYKIAFVFSYSSWQFFFFSLLSLSLSLSRIILLTRLIFLF